jgi:hypothetical protein
MVKESRVSLLYISDVEFFLMRSGTFSEYIANLDALPWADDAQIIRTSTRPLEGHPERLPGDSATTVIRSASAFREAARAGRIRTVDDLFMQEDDAR